MTEEQMVAKVMSLQGKRSVEARHKGKTKKQISEYYSKLSNKKNANLSRKV